MAGNSNRLRVGVKNHRGDFVRLALVFWFGCCITLPYIVRNKLGRLDLD